MKKILLVIVMALLAFVGIVNAKERKGILTCEEMQQRMDYIDGLKRLPIQEGYGIMPELITDTLLNYMIEALEGYETKRLNPELRYCDTCSIAKRYNDYIWWRTYSILLNFMNRLCGDIELDYRAYSKYKINVKPYLKKYEKYKEYITPGELNYFNLMFTFDTLASLYILRDWGGEVGQHIDSQIAREAAYFNALQMMIKRDQATAKKKK